LTLPLPLTLTLTLQRVLVLDAVRGAVVSMAIAR
jgi:hypothetical protein